MVQINSEDFVAKGSNRRWMGWNNTSKPSRIGDEWVENRQQMGIVENRWRMGWESAMAGAEITLQSVADEGKVSLVRTRRCIANNLETKSGFIGNNEWLIDNGSSVTVQRWIISNDSLATVHWQRFIGNGSTFHVFFLFGFLFFWPKTPVAERFLFCWVGECFFIFLGSIYSGS